MKFYNVCSVKEYEENGEIVRKWYRVGHIKETPNGGRFLTLYHLPDTKFFIFENKDDEHEITEEG